MAERAAAAFLKQVYVGNRNLYWIVNFCARGKMKLCSRKTGKREQGGRTAKKGDREKDDGIVGLMMRTTGDLAQNTIVSIRN